jgi:thiaminase
VSAPTTPGERLYFLMPEVERVLAITMAVAQELAVARTRIDSLERLLEHKGVMTRAEIEGFEPTAAEAAERDIWTQDYIAHVLEALQRELDQLRDARS